MAVRGDSSESDVSALYGEEVVLGGSSKPREGLVFSLKPKSCCAM